MKAVYVVLLLISIILALHTTPTDAFGEVVNRTFCPNRCSSVGDCLNMTLSDEVHQTYQCDCKYKSQFDDCSDQTRIPLIFSIILAIIVIVVFAFTFCLFAFCNAEFDARQRYYSSNSVLSR